MCSYWRSRFGVHAGCGMLGPYPARPPRMPVLAAHGTAPARRPPMSVWLALFWGGLSSAALFLGQALAPASSHTPRPRGS